MSLYGPLLRILCVIVLTEAGWQGKGAIENLLLALIQPLKAGEPLSHLHCEWGFLRTPEPGYNQASLNNSPTHGPRLHSNHMKGAR